MKQLRRPTQKFNETHRRNCERMQEMIEQMGYKVSLDDIAWAYSRWCQRGWCVDWMAVDVTGLDKACYAVVQALEVVE